ncbi:hypothetical protein B0A55_00161 [Friedmanniomyces simplex]|uniref:Uncharacterized protein n=1 Tax=Friedmanniomyces simplex TaxID=329884 RepID=A0A4U0Y4R6_9PEZI|nr:hypothetical protein B0A55_00161 [Friedmanniomyces simplex]
MTSQEPQYEAIAPPPGYRKLTYFPLMLSPKVTLFLAALYFVLMGGAIVLYLLANERTAYPVQNVNLYLAARYGPAVIAIITSSLFKSTIQELRRMLPYINMADRRRGRAIGPGSYSVGALYWPLLYGPNTPGTWIIRFFMPFTTALIASKTLLINVVEQNNTWLVVIHRGVAVLLAAYYALSGGLTLLLTCWLWGRETGLREDWDPRSLADIIALFYWSNLDASFVSGSPRDRHYLRGTRFRLGYWKRGRDEIVYGIRVISETASTGNEIPSRKKGPNAYVYTPLMSRIMLIFWASAAFVVLLLLLYAAAAGYVSNGFAVQDFLVHGLNSSAGHLNASLSLGGDIVAGLEWISRAEANALLATSTYLRALPIWFLTAAFEYSIALDAHFRYMQPLYNMRRGPCLAEDSILLGYLNMSPLEVTREAFQRSHWKVFYYSILSAVSTTLILVPVGTLALTHTGDNLIIGQFSWPFYIGSVVIISIYIVSCLFAWPPDRRRAPRQTTSLIDIWTMFRNSRLCQQTEFGRCESYWGPEHLASTIQLRRDQYLLGICHGEDGKDSLGFDVCFDGETGQPTAYVDKVAPKSSRRKNVNGAKQRNEAEVEEGFELEEGLQRRR